MRKFITAQSAGLRVRLHPSLQSEQIGVIKPGGVITFTSETHNNDGVWLRLSAESVRACCSLLNGYRFSVLLSFLNFIPQIYYQDFKCNTQQQCFLVFFTIFYYSTDMLSIIMTSNALHNNGAFLSVFERFFYYSTDMLP